MNAVDLLADDPMRLKKLGHLVSLAFEDGVIIDNVTPGELSLNRFVWSIFEIRRIPIISAYHIANFYVNGQFSGDTINDMFTRIMGDIAQTLPLDENLADIIAEMNRMVFQVNNDIYSIFGYDTLNSVTSIDIMDLVELQLNKNIMDAMKKVEKEMSIASINNAYSVIDDVMVNDPDLKLNTVSRSYVAKTVKGQQLMQVIGPRGFVTELDGTIFSTPISNSFVLGLRDLYSFSIESRSAAKALSESNNSIRQSEYFARELQLVTMVVRGIGYEDCGNTEYMEWYVRPKEFSADGTEIYKGDLTNLIGKYYKLKTNEPWQRIDKHMKELEGKTIKLRSALHCKYPDKYKICAKCLGDVALSIPRHANLGHVCGTTFTSRLSQSILSTKHLIASASGGVIKLDQIAEKVLTVKKNGIAFKVDELAKYDKVLLYVSHDEFFGLKVIDSLEKVKLLDPKRVSKVESITIELYKGEEVERLPINIRQGNRFGVFTDKFIEHVVTTGITIDEYSNYVIDVTNRKQTREFMFLPEVEYSFFALQQEIKNLIFSRTVLKGGKSKDTPESLLIKMFELANTKLSINLSMFEVIVYAFSVKDLANGNYDLARGVKHPQLASIGDIIRNRSLGGLYGYGALVQNMHKAGVFNTDNIVDHPMDALLEKDMVVEESMH